MTPLRRLLVAQVPADFADLLDFVAIAALLTYRWQSDPVVYAWLAVAMALPYLVIGPFAGLLVDRMDTRRALILSNLGRGLGSALMVLAPGVPTLLLLIALRGAADSVFTPAKQSALQTLAPGALSAGANSTSHAINQASKIIAPSLGGLALLWLPPSLVFLVTASISVLAALILTGLPGLPIEPGPRQSLATELQGGLTELRTKPILRHILALLTLSYFAMFFYDTLIAPLLRDLGQSAAGLGLSIGAVGGGGVLGALTLGRATARKPFLWIAGGAVLSTVMIATLGFAGLNASHLPLTLIAAIFAALGFATACTLVPTRSLLQQHVAPDRMGRVTALSEAANALAILIAPFLGATLASRYGTGAAFLAGAVLLSVLALTALRSAAKTAYI